MDNVFDRTRNKLSLQYSGVLIVFLSLFVIIVYALLYAFIWNDQHQRLNNLADRELLNLKTWADHDDNPKRPPPRSVEDTFTISTDQSFYYLIAENGMIQLGDEIQAELREQVMGLIADGQFGDQKVSKVALLTTSTGSAAIEGSTTAASEAAKFIITDRVLEVRGERIATLYLGKEVTFQHDLFRWLLWLLLGMALLFFILAVGFSHLMSRKAMVPIAETYARQREFVADASHELRTPLSVMLASIETLQLEESIAADPFSHKVLTGLKAEVSSMTKLAGSLLHLARSDSNEPIGDQSLFDASLTAVQVVDKLRPLADSKLISLTLHAPAELRIKWDAEKLTQLLVLLMDNAIKYTPNKGFVQVTLAEKADKEGRFFTIEVKDSGMGIPADALPRIFDRFYRQDKSRTRQGGGHGLGLAIAKGIVDTSRGSIHVDSEPGKGSTFRVRLPL